MITKGDFMFWILANNPWVTWGKLTAALQDYYGIVDNPHTPVHGKGKKLTGSDIREYQPNDNAKNRMSNNETKCGQDIKVSDRWDCKIID